MHVFVNLTGLEGSVERTGSVGPKVLDFSALGDQTMGEIPVKFTITKEKIIIEPAGLDGSAGVSPLTDNLQGIFSNDPTPITWVLTDELYLTEELESRVKLLVCGDYFLIGLIKGRVKYDTPVGLMEMTRWYNGKREKALPYIPDTFPNISNQPIYRDAVYDIKVRVKETHGGRIVDFRTTPVKPPTLIDNGIHRKRAEEEKRLKLEEKNRYRNERRERIRKIEEQKALERKERRKDISADFLSILQDASKAK